LAESESRDAYAIGPYRFGGSFDLFGRSPVAFLVLGHQKDKDSITVGSHLVE
jgi:hypothetical protein